VKFTDMSLRCAGKNVQADALRRYWWEFVDLLVADCLAFCNSFPGFL